MAAQAVYNGKRDGVALAMLLVEKDAYVAAVGEHHDGIHTSLPAVVCGSGGEKGHKDGLALAKLLVEKGAPGVNAAGTDDNGNQGTPLWWAAVAVNGDKEHGEALVRLLVSAGAELADTERAAHLQGTIDGVMGQRNKMRAAFFGCPGTTDRTALRVRRRGYSPF
jgi:hypothetical protein